MTGPAPDTREVVRTYLELTAPDQLRGTDFPAGPGHGRAGIRTVRSVEVAIVAAPAGEASDIKGT